MDAPMAAECFPARKRKLRLRGISAVWPTIIAAGVTSQQSRDVVAPKGSRDTGFQPLTIGENARVRASAGLRRDAAIFRGLQSVPSLRSRTGRTGG